MLELKCNFKSLHNNLKCRICGQHEENQEGLLSCQALKGKSETNTAKYSDIFSQDKNQIRITAMILKTKYELFQHLQVHGQTTDITIGQPCAAASTNINLINVNASNVDMD